MPDLPQAAVGHWASPDLARHGADRPNAHHAPSAAVAALMHVSGDRRDGSSAENENAGQRPAFVAHDSAG
jgi:hypothetical protein